MTAPTAIDPAFLRMQEDSLTDPTIPPIRNVVRPGPAATGPGANSPQEEHTP